MRLDTTLDFQRLSITAFHYTSITLLFVTVFSATPVHTSTLSDVSDGFHIIYDILKIWKLVDEKLDDRIVPSFLKSREQVIIERMTSITNSISQVEDRLLSGTISAIDNLQQDLPEIIRLELRLDRLLEKTSIIEAANHKFKEYVSAGFKNTKNFESYTLENFAENIVSHRAGSVVNVMEQLHDLLVPTTWQQQFLTNKGGILNQIRKAIQGVYVKGERTEKRFSMPLATTLMMAAEQRRKVMRTQHWTQFHLIISTA